MDKILEKRLKQCADQAEETGQSHREVVLERLSQWRDVLRIVSEDYRGMNEEQYYRMTEMEIDSWEQRED